MELSGWIDVLRPRPAVLSEFLEPGQVEPPATPGGSSTRVRGSDEVFALEVGSEVVAFRIDLFPRPCLRFPDVSVEQSHAVELAEAQAEDVCGLLRCSDFGHWGRRVVGGRRFWTHQ